MLAPAALLAFILSLAVAAAIVEAVRRRRLWRQYRRLARATHMHFSSRDRLRLTNRIAAEFPVPGAAHVVVRDLFYSSDSTGHRYVFTAEYTAGTLRARRRIRCAAAFRECRPDSVAKPHRVVLARMDRPLFQQVRELVEQRGEDRTS